MRMNDSLYLQELEQLFNQKWLEQKKEQQEEDNKTNKMGEGGKIEMTISELEKQKIEHKQPLEEKANPVEEQANPAEEQTVSKDKTLKVDEEETAIEENPENTE
ncbi:hypothetical protein [Cytobacillus firmus]|uniref:hypothetical protein n=1 Tax=Cytobacillus firmus TaxID=1399 RepID=UPI0021BD0904|nr:hypothetical protein [Cytobacillus firmus]